MCEGTIYHYKLFLGNLFDDVGEGEGPHIQGGGKHPNKSILMHQIGLEDYKM